MFAIIALICFVLALFGVHLGSLNLVVLGLAFLSLHFIFTIPVTTVWRRDQ